MDTSTPRSDAVAATLMIAICLPFIFSLDEIYIDPFDAGFSARDFPVGALFAIVVLSLVLLVRSIRRMYCDGTRFVDKTAVREHLQFGLPILVLSVSYVGLFVMFQYLVPTAVVMCLVLYMFKNRGWIRLGLVPIVASVAFYTLFFGVLSLYEFPGSVLRYDASPFWHTVWDVF